MAPPTLMIQDRTKKVKDAKTEAQKEIEEYRKKKEEEYKKFESEVSTLPHIVLRPDVH
jgi:V-type H+-transporting ATPase subunit G